MSEGSQEATGADLSADQPTTAPGDHHDGERAADANGGTA